MSIMTPAFLLWQLKKSCSLFHPRPDPECELLFISLLLDTEQEACRIRYASDRILSDQITHRLQLFPVNVFQVMQHHLAGHIPARRTMDRVLRDSQLIFLENRGECTR